MPTCRCDDVPRGVVAGHAALGCGRPCGIGSGVDVQVCWISKADPVRLDDAVAYSVSCLRHGFGKWLTSCRRCGCVSTAICCIRQELRMNTAGPIRDGNETWLVTGGDGLNWYSGRCVPRKLPRHHPAGGLRQSVRRSDSWGLDLHGVLVSGISRQGAWARGLRPGVAAACTFSERQGWPVHPSASHRLSCATSSSVMATMR